MKEQEYSPQNDEGQDRHYDVICLTLTSIGGATLAAVMLLSDAPDILQGDAGTSLSFPQWIRIILAASAAGAYAAMTATSRMAILQRPKPNLSLTEHNRKLTSWVFNILIGMAVALVLVTTIIPVTALIDPILNGGEEAKWERSPYETPPQ